MYPVSSPQRVLLLILILTLGSVVSAQDRSARFFVPLNTTSPFQPPKANDYTFVINDGAGLDTGCSYRGDGPLRITLPIGRVLGELNKLKQNGLVPATVRLEFPAFDVDSAGAQGVPPERDRVTFIGKDNVPHVVSGEFMTGLNDKWIMQRFDIPIEWLNLPPEPTSGSVSPANNEIRIDIDTASGADENWCTAVDWVTITIENPIPPRPWIGAHGIFSTNSIWSTFWVPRIRDLGIPADPGPNMGTLDTIQSNAAKISAAVSAAKARWGVDRVNIMAHSKGGLDARDYIENTDTVENLVQLGTPNAGSPLADAVEAGSIALLDLEGSIKANQLLGGLGGYQLTRPYMFVYNFFHGSNSKVTYTAIGGHQIPGSWRSDPGGNILQLIVGEGDLIVPLSSVHALPFTTNYTVFSTYPPTFGPASHTGIHHNQDAYALVSHLITAPGLESNRAVISSGRGVPKPMEVASANTETQRSQTFGGKLQQPQTATHVIAVDSASTLAFTLLHPAGDLDLKLTDPHGQVFDAATIVGRTDVSRQESEIPGGFIETYAFTGPIITGNWTATVIASNTNGLVDYNVTAWLENAPLQMTAAVNTLSTPTGGSFILSATLTNGALPVTGATVNAAVILPDGITSQTVALLDNGAAPDTLPNDGVYTANFSGTSQAGPYGIAIDATGTISGTQFSRETYLTSFVTASSSKILSGLHDFGRDLNGNGLFDQLALEVPVQITASGTYRLAATLMDSSNNMLETSNSFALTPASTSVQLVFDGALLFAHGVNGPYKITSVRLAEERNQVLLPLTVTTSVYNTAPYLFSQFEGAGLALTGTNSAIGVDTNGNGKFDALQADIGVNIRTAGSYQWSARLRDQNGHEIALASGSGNLAAGVSSIRLSFDGSAIGHNGIDGPFNITDLLLFSAADTLSTANVFSTSPIPAAAFEGFVAPAATLQFSSDSYMVLENQHSVEISVTRLGLTAGAVSVNYQTVDSTATERADYATATGAINFAPGEAIKKFHVLITDDAYIEGNESFKIVLSAPTGGAALGTPDTASVSIISDDTDPNASNPVDNSEFFVRQQYHDFLNREPDPAGLDYWTHEISKCGTDQRCISNRRLDIAAAFFIELEFQQTGFYIYRLYQSALGRRPSYTEFTTDRSRLMAGPDLALQLKTYTEDFVQRSEFTGKYPITQTGEQFIDALLANVQLVSGLALTTKRQELINEYLTGATAVASRARVLNKLVDYQEYRNAEFNRGFVLAEYYGFLRRNVDEGGYQFWLDVLNNRAPGNYRSLGCAFITSREYQQRFGALVPHSNDECN
jgi:hypothetical protein